MKPLLLSFILSALPLPAALVKVSYNANPEPELAGYQLWLRNADGTGSKLSASVGKATTISTDLPAGRHTIYLTAFSDDGLHSEPSDPLIITILGKPTGLKVALEWSNDLQTWKVLATYTDESAPVASRRFYRVSFPAAE